MNDAQLDMFFQFMDEHPAVYDKSDKMYYFKGHRSSLFEDLAASHNCVLMRGDFTGHMSKLDAQRLVELTKAYYLDSAKYRDVDVFNHAPREFDYAAHFGRCDLSNPDWRGGGTGKEDA